MTDHFGCNAAIDRERERTRAALAEVERLKSLDWVTIYDAHDEVAALRGEASALASLVEGKQALIDELRADVERLRADYDDALNAVAAWVPRAERAEAAVGAVRVLHANEDGYCDACADDAPPQVRWEPCATIRALDAPHRPGVGNDVHGEG